MKPKNKYIKTYKGLVGCMLYNVRVQTNESLKIRCFDFSYVFFLILLFSTLFSSCVTSDRIVNPQVRHTGTANEPGTRMQPYPRADYEYNDRYTKNVEREFLND